MVEFSRKPIIQGKSIESILFNKLYSKQSHGNEYRWHEISWVITGKEFDRS